MHLCNTNAHKYEDMNRENRHFGQIPNFHEAGWLPQMWHQAHQADAKQVDCTCAYNTKLMLTDNQDGALCC